MYNFTKSDYRVIADAIINFVIVNSGVPYISFDLYSELENGYEWKFIYSGILLNKDDINDCLRPMFWNLELTDNGIVVEHNCNDLNDIFA